jgi:cytochrome P450
MAAREKLAAHVTSAVGNYQAGTGNHVLRRLSEARDDAGQPMSREDLETELLHFFSAAYAGLRGSGVDMVLALAQNPAVLEKARGGDAQYIDQITREVRRYYDIAPSTFFARAKVDCAFNGHRIPKGWKAVAPIYPVMQDEKNFPEPKRFDPDRFAPERGELKKDPAAWVPHGAGPMDGHRCAGEQLAHRILVAFGKQLVAGYSWELPQQDFTYVPMGLGSLPKDGLRVVFKKR